MSAHTTEKDNDSQRFPELPCPVCIEAASELVGGEEIVPNYALKRYTFAQLENHLNSNIHSQEEFAEVALRAALFLYREAFEHAYEKIEDL